MKKKLCFHIQQVVANVATVVSTTSKNKDNLQN